MPPIAVILALITLIQWSFLAFLGTRLSHIPPFLLVGIALSVSGLTSSYTYRTWRIPFRTFSIGVWGIFGYHFFFFLALRFAPPIEANLINYLWPLLTVVLSPLFLKGYPLHLHHGLGAVLGLLGAGLIVSGGKLQLDIHHLDGYLLALCAAVSWSTYSLLTKKVPPFPTTAIGGICLFSGLISFGVYFMESCSFDAFSLLSLADWIYLVLTGLGPMGLAFFTWDAALKRGDPRIIGALAYLNPMLSTLNLVVWGGYSISWIAILAMLLIVSGAAMGSLDLFRKKAPMESNQTNHEPDRYFRRR